MAYRQIMRVLAIVKIKTQVEVYILQMLMMKYINVILP